MSNKQMNYLAGQFRTKAKDNKVIIRGLANAAVVDRGKDFVEPTAFTASDGLENFKINPMILYNHNPNFEIGKALKVVPTEDGLAVEVEISDSDDPDTTRVRNNIKQGILKTFSIGFETRAEEPDEKGINRIKDAELFEVSVVTIPMNQASTFALIQKARTDDAYCRKSLDDLEKGDMPKDEEDEDKKENKQILVGKTGETNDHAHDVQVESETKEGSTISVLGEAGGDHKHDIVDGVVQAAGEDDHAHTLNMDSLAPPATDAPQDEESPAEDRSDKADEQKSEEENGEASEEQKQEEDLTVQTLIFAKSKFDKAEALSWAQEHSFKAEKVDETEDSYRLRQRDPSEFVEGSFKTVALTDGVNAVMGKLQEAQEKQADQEGVDGPTVPLQTQRADDDFGNPHLETAKQTNVLLGQVIGELQKLQAQVLQMQTTSTEPQDQKTEDETVNEEVNESESTNVDNLSNQELTDKLSEEKVSATKANLVQSSTRYLERLDERLKRLGV